MAQPEKLTLWDFFFNRYRREVLTRSSERWFKTAPGTGKIPNSEYTRDYVDYKIIDRHTGSETIERKYLC